MSEFSDEEIQRLVNAVVHEEHSRHKPTWGARCRLCLGCLILGAVVGWAAPSSLDVASSDYGRYRCGEAAWIGVEEPPDWRAATLGV